MCELFRILGLLFIGYGMLDIILSRFGFDLSRKVGFKKFSYFAPYIFIVVGVILASITQSSCGYF